MAFPFVLSRMKEPNNCTCLGIYSGNVWPFVVVACKTSQRQVIDFISPVMFASNNVIDLKSQQVILLRHPAVLTYRTRPLPNLIDE